MPVTFAVCGLELLAVTAVLATWFRVRLAETSRVRPSCSTFSLSSSTSCRACGAPRRAGSRSGRALHGRIARIRGFAPAGEGPRLRPEGRVFVPQGADLAGAGRVPGPPGSPPARLRAFEIPAGRPPARYSTRVRSRSCSSSDRSESRSSGWPRSPQRIRSRSARSLVPFRPHPGQVRVQALLLGPALLAFSLESLVLTQAISSSRN